MWYEKVSEVNWKGWSKLNKYCRDNKKKQQQNNKWTKKDRKKVGVREYDDHRLYNTHSSRMYSVRYKNKKAKYVYSVVNVIRFWYIKCMFLI